MLLHPSKNVKVKMVNIFDTVCFIMLAGNVLRVCDERDLEV